MKVTECCTVGEKSCFLNRVPNLTSMLPLELISCRKFPSWRLIHPSPAQSKLDSRTAERGMGEQGNFKSI